MGRITIFALEECPHCKRAKTALKDRGIPFTEISLSTHPHRRTDMIALSDRMSVPQVFFNDRHIGGADETIALLEQWDKKPGQNPLELYNEDVASQPDPTDKRLRLSTEPPTQPKKALPRDDADNLPIPNGKTLTMLELVQTLKPLLVGRDIVTPFKVYKNAFTGAEGAAALVQGFDLNEEDAVVLGDLLLQRKIIQTIRGDYQFSSSPCDIFRLHCYDTPHILNSYRVWDTRVDPDSVGVLSRLQKLLGKVESAVTDKNGLVDYKKAQETEHFPIFEEAVCELQGMDLENMNYKSRLAFCINLYNLMIKYSFIKVGIHVNTLGLLTYFTDILFNVGGNLYSFHDLESGILRGNRPPPYNLSPPIRAADPRIAAVFPVNEVDCRIHFGLNCGAKSCPPVKNFTPEGIEEELRIVAMAFAEDNENVEIDTKNRVLTLSQIINWYRVDFAPSNKELPQKIVQFLRGEKAQKLQAMIDDGKSIKIKFRTYDWSTNASDHIVYSKANITADYVSLKSICCSLCLRRNAKNGPRRTNPPLVDKKAN